MLWYNKWWNERLQNWYQYLILSHWSYQLTCPLLVLQTYLPHINIFVILFLYYGLIFHLGWSLQNSHLLGNICDHSKIIDKSLTLHTSQNLAAFLSKYAALNMLFYLLFECLPLGFKLHECLPHCHISSAGHKIIHMALKQQIF